MIDLADLLMIIHFLWAAFMVLGLPLGVLLRSPAIRWLHFGGMTLTALIALSGAYCPLTRWENLLRTGKETAFGDGGSFLGHHLAAVLYPEIQPWVLRAASVTWGGITILTMILMPPGSRVRRAVDNIDG